MNSGFEDDEAYNVYSEAWRKGSNIGSNIYRPTKNTDKELYGGEDIDELRKTNRFQRQGASIDDVCRIVGFFDPLPPLYLQNLYCLSANFVRLLTIPPNVLQTVGKMASVGLPRGL